MVVLARAVVVGLIAVASLSGCGGDGIDPYVGTWYTGAGGEGSDIKTLVIHDDGTTSFSGSASCTGTTEKKGDRVRITVDCGSANGIGESTEAPKDGKFVLRWDDGDVDEFRTRK